MKDASPIEALDQAERLLAARLMTMGEQLKTKGGIENAQGVFSSVWAEYARLAEALTCVMRQRRGPWEGRGPGRPPFTGPKT
jgi:hypothetical protein